MAVIKTEFDDFIAGEIKKSKGVYYPVKSGILRRLLMKKAKCSEMHPNPSDEFCDPAIGPSYRIISEYQKQFLTDIRFHRFFDNEPIVIEKAHPDGYIILNGHHRWAAAIRIRQEKVPVKLVTLMHEEDVKRILASTGRSKRAVLDLDEAVFTGDPAEPAEKPLRFPFGRIYTERIRLGVPALFHFLTTHGYDVWLYSSGYYSFDYVQRYFRRYGVKVTGVISAANRQSKAAREQRRKLEQSITESYSTTLHIDPGAVLEVNNSTGEYADHELSSSGGRWPQEAIGVIERIGKGGA